jgi:lipoic acid synthetase
MLGLGEQEEEVFQTMRDLRDANVDVVTIVNTNQVKHLPVKVITPDQFAIYEKKYGLELDSVMREFGH